MSDREAPDDGPPDEGDFDCSVPPDFEPPPPPPGRQLAPKPVPAPCSRSFTAVHSSGRRPNSAIGLVVIHCTQSDTARSAAAWFANPRSGGSAHLCVDDAECFRTLGNDAVPWGAPGANTRGVHIEIAGYAEWSRADWMRHERALRRGAFKAALHARMFGIPLRVLTPDQLKAGAKGFVTHAICTTAFGDSHWDPGKRFPLSQFMSWVAEYARTP